jgi:hypothetical protein
MKIAAMVALVATVASTAAVAATTRASVVVISRAPVSVQGSGFRSRELVTVTFMATDDRRKTVTASRKGGFLAKFAGTTIDRCESYVVRAKGNRGSLAVVKVMPECAPAGPAG